MKKIILSKITILLFIILAIPLINAVTINQEPNIDSGYMEMLKNGNYYFSDNYVSSNSYERNYFKYISTTYEYQKLDGEQSQTIGTDSGFSYFEDNNTFTSNVFIHPASYLIANPSWKNKTAIIGIGTDRKVRIFQYTPTDDYKWSEQIIDLHALYNQDERTTATVSDCNNDGQDELIILSKDGSDDDYSCYQYNTSTSSLSKIKTYNFTKPFDSFINIQTLEFTTYIATYKTTYKNLTIDIYQISGGLPSFMKEVVTDTTYNPYSISGSFMKADYGTLSLFYSFWQTHTSNGKDYSYYMTYRAYEIGTPFDASETLISGGGACTDFVGGNCAGWKSFIGYYPLKFGNGLATTTNYKMIIYQHGVQYTGHSITSGGEYEFDTNEFHLGDIGGGKINDYNSNYIPYNSYSGTGWDICILYNSSNILKQHCVSKNFSESSDVTCLGATTVNSAYARTLFTTNSYFLNIFGQLINNKILFTPFGLFNIDLDKCQVNTDSGITSSYPYNTINTADINTPTIIHSIFPMWGDNTNTPMIITLSARNGGTIRWISEVNSTQIQNLSTYPTISGISLPNNPDGEYCPLENTALLFKIDIDNITEQQGYRIKLDCDGTGNFITNTSLDITYQTSQVYGNNPLYFSCPYNVNGFNTSGIKNFKIQLKNENTSKESQVYSLQFEIPTNEQCNILPILNFTSIQGIKIISIEQQYKNPTNALDSTHIIYFRVKESGEYIVKQFAPWQMPMADFQLVTCGTNTLCNATFNISIGKQNYLNALLYTYEILNTNDTYASSTTPSVLRQAYLYNTINMTGATAYKYMQDLTTCANIRMRLTNPSSDFDSTKLTQIPDYMGAILPAVGIMKILEFAQILPQQETYNSNKCSIALYDAVMRSYYPLPKYFGCDQQNIMPIISVQCSKSDTCGGYPLYLTGSDIIYNDCNNTLTTPEIIGQPNQDDFVVIQQNMINNLGFKSQSSRILLGCGILLMIVLACVMICTFTYTTQALPYAIPAILLIGYIFCTYLGLFPIGIMLVMVVLAILFGVIKMTSGQRP